MCYVVNVAINGKHYFATSEHSIDNEKQAKQVADELESFYTSKNTGTVRVTITFWEKIGHPIERD